MVRGKPWYEPDIKWHNFGVKYSFSPWAVAGEDIAIPQGTPITAIFAGTVAWRAYDGGGANIVIKIANTGLSRGIAYYFYVHLDDIDPRLGVGARINEGQFIGYSGGQLTAGGPKYPPGYSHHPNDGLHSTGPHIMYGLSDVPYIYAAGIRSALNPYWLLDYARAINLPWGEGSKGRASSGVPFSDISSGSALLLDIWPEQEGDPALPEKKMIDLSPDASISEVLAGVDESLTFSNIFDVNTRSLHIPVIPGVTFSETKITSPISWMAQVGTGIVNNTNTAIVRIILIIIGFWIIYTVINRFFDFSTLKSGDIGRNALRAIL